MPFQLIKTSCVAVGTFNIYIIQPAWLVGVGILPLEDEITLAADMTKPGFKLSSPKLKSTWYVSPGKLGIEASVPDEDCGHHVAEVLKHLSWTPVVSLGNNVQYQANRGDIETFPALEACSLGAVQPDGYTENRRLFVTAVEKEGRTYTLQVIVRGDVVQLHGNAHVNLTGEITTERAVSYASGFRNDQQHLAQLFSDVLGVRLLNVISHSA